MTISSKPLAILIVVLMFGGIALSSAFGWWQTESSKVPAAYTDGEFAGQANPADIRGSYTFGDIAQAFNVSPELLAQAFEVTADDPAVFAVKDLEAAYSEGDYEIGTNSVRLFVAFSLDLPFDTTGQDIYLPQAAADILLSQGTLSPEQATYVLTHTVDLSAVPSTDGETVPAQSAESTPEPEATQSALEAKPSDEDTTVKGKTTFGELIQWGVSQETIENIIGAPMPAPAMKVKDFATADGQTFETLKETLQAEVDKVSP
jgi:hypothetical protein